MNRDSNIQSFLKLGSPLFLAALIGLTSCSSPALRPEIQASPATTVERGAELWAATCRRCHVPRSLNKFDAKHWDVTMLHMRVRANLTGEEARLIRSFLATLQK